MIDVSETENKQELNRYPRYIAYNSAKSNFFLLCRSLAMPTTVIHLLYFILCLFFLAFSSERKANIADVYYISAPSRMRQAFILADC